MVAPAQRTDSEPLLSMPTYTPASTFSDDTRRLCCAPYVDIGFANAVIREVVQSERKAVPPSFGFDLDPVVRHCLRARRLLIVRYALVTVVLAAGLVTSPVATVTWLALCALIMGLRTRFVRQLPWQFRIVLWAGSFTFLFVAAIGTLAALFAEGLILQDVGRGDGSLWGLVESFFEAGAAGLRMVAPILLAAAMFLVLFLTRRHAYAVLITELAPGARSGAPRSSSSRIEWRLGVVAAMQRGNIAVHATEPYTGAGGLMHGWSIAVSLKPRRVSDAGIRRARDRVQIESNALNQRVSDAILALRDPQLRSGERIPNVYVVPYVAADGNRRADDPLIDPATRTPRTMASAETIAAIEACPQGGLRHYLRAVVPANGKEIRTPDDRLVLPAQDTGISTTAFVHLAVEGGMLYAEFMTTVMPEVGAKYHLVDQLRPETIAGRAAVDTFRIFVRDNLIGPVNLVTAGWEALRLPARMARSGKDADEFRSYDYGAEFSVRELAADFEIVKFLQRLDAWKYIKLLDRTVTEAVIDFLDDQGIDTDDFFNAVTNISNHYGDVHNSVGGIQNFGGQNTNIQHNHNPGTPSGTSGGTGSSGGASP